VAGGQRLNNRTLPDGRGHHASGRAGLSGLRCDGNYDPEPASADCIAPFGLESSHEGRPRQPRKSSPTAGSEGRRYPNFDFFSRTESRVPDTQQTHASLPSTIPHWGSLSLMRAGARLLK